MHSLKAFLFCCYTGIRYSDFVLLNESNIVTIKGEKWLIFKTVKTDTKVSIPLYLLFQGKALRLLQEYHQNLSDFFHLKSNSSVNKDLKKTLGHQSVKTTQGYSDIFSGTIVKDLKKCKF